MNCIVCKKTISVKRLSKMDISELHNIPVCKKHILKVQDLIKKNKNRRVD